jgi:hypothetical protein
MTGSFDRAGHASRIATALLARYTAAGAVLGAVDGEPAAVDRDPAPTPLDYPRLQRMASWLDGLLRIHHAVARLTVARGAGPGPDNGDGDAELGALTDAIRRAHLVLLAHPVATKSAYAALAAEGRRFARTTEGTALRAGLEGSPRLRRAALLWRSITMGLLDEDEHALPAAYLDHLLRSVDRADLERLIGLAYRDGVAPP